VRGTRDTACLPRKVVSVTINMEMISAREKKRNTEATREKKNNRRTSGSGIACWAGKEEARKEWGITQRKMTPG